MAQTLGNIYKRSTFCSLFDTDTKTILFSASGEDFKYTGDAVSIIYPQPGMLTRRSSRPEDDDNIAVDSARVISRVAPMRVSLVSRN